MSNGTLAGGRSCWVDKDNRLTNFSGVLILEYKSTKFSFGRLSKTERDEMWIPWLSLDCLWRFQDASETPSGLYSVSLFTVCPWYSVALSSLLFINLRWLVRFWTDDLVGGFAFWVSQRVRRLPVVMCLAGGSSLWLILCDLHVTEGEICELSVHFYNFLEMFDSIMI